MVQPAPPSATAAESPLSEPDTNALFFEYQPLVRRLIRQYADGPEMREDMLGELYFRFRGLLERFDPARGVPLRAYVSCQLSASAYSIARSKRQKEWRELSMVAPGWAEYREPREDPTPQWQWQISAGQVADSLPAMLETLSPMQRRVLQWRYYEGRSFEWIASRLGIRAATARSHLRHAIEALRRRARERGLPVPGASPPSR